MTYGHYSNLPLPVTSAVGRAGAIHRPLDSRGDVRNRIALAAVNAYIKYLSDNPNDFFSPNQLANLANDNTKDTTVNPGYDANGFADNDLLALTDTERKLILALRAARETKTEYDRKAKVAECANEESDEACDKWCEAQRLVRELKNAL